jgi:hypothetical protein
MDDLRDIAFIRPTLPSYALRRIGLNFSNAQYITFFGARLSLVHINGIPGLGSRFNLGPAPGNAAADVLNDGRLPSLAHLDIKFQSTRWSPWTDPWIVKWRAHVGNSMDCWGPCQKTATEIILTLALEYVYHIDEVTLEGDVKYSTQLEFKRALEEKKEKPECEPDWPITKTKLFNQNGWHEYV